MNENQMLHEALELAARGWHVFPAHSSGEKKSHKSAKFSNGSKWGKTCDPQEIKRDFKRWPQANIGIATGRESGFFVVECDTPEGHAVDGIASLKALQTELGPLPPTLMANSPSGSMHYYFKWPEGVFVRNSTSKIASGIDVRGEGGMVIAPPSNRPGKGKYRWVNDIPIVEAPPWLIDLATADDGDGARTPSDDPQADDELLAAAMDVIPNDEGTSWASWNDVGMALFRASGGSEAGFDLFNKWSKKWPRYNGSRTSERWRAYAASPPDRIGAGTIFRMATEASPG
jgi:hypothetical protein